MTAEGLFEAYLSNNSRVTKDYSLFDIFIVDDFIECWHDDRLFGFVVYQYEKSKRGFVEIFTASEEYGICEEDGKIDTDTSFDIWLDRLLDENLKKIL